MFENPEIFGDCELLHWVILFITIKAELISWLICN